MRSLYYCPERAINIFIALISLKYSVIIIDRIDKIYRILIRKTLGI